MERGAWLRINGKYLRAGLEALAEEGYSGHVRFQMSGRNIFHTQSELFPFSGEVVPNKDALPSVARNWVQIQPWLDSPDSGLLIFFHRGVITKIETQTHFEHSA